MAALFIMHRNVETVGIFIVHILKEKKNPYFYASTVVKEEPLIATDDDEFQPDVSPDGKEIAYLDERNVLKVYNIASKKSRTHCSKRN